MADPTDCVIHFEQAKSGRSSCRATGEALEKGAWRVGVEVWIGGRVAMAWMKPLPFLQDCCRVEYCLSAGGNQGTCKASQLKFRRGDVRFVCTAGDPHKKVYLSVAAAGAQLGPVLQHVGRRAFAPIHVQGLADLAAADRAAFYQAFAVSKAEAAKFDHQHPPPPPPSLEKPAKAKAKSKAEAAAAPEAATEEAAGAAEGRPAKRARGSVTDSASKALGTAVPVAATATDGAQGEGSDGAAVPAPNEAEAEAEIEIEEEDPHQGLTPYELQRLEQMRRNRERLMALNLPGMAAELMPGRPPRPPAGAQHKGVSLSRKRLSEAAPRRESSRIRGIAADGTQVHSERQGEVVVVAGEVIRRYASGSMTEEQEPQDRHPQGEQQFESSNCSPGTDESFIQLLAHAAAGANSGSSGRVSGGGSKAHGSSKAGSGGGRGSGLMGAAEMARLRLAPNDVAKVTREATTHLAFHPTTDTLLLACADKRGNIGLWHVNEGSYDLPAAARRTAPILRRPAKPAAGNQQQSEDGAEGQVEEEEEVGEEGGSTDRKPAATSGAVSLDAAAGGGGKEPSSGSASEAFDGVLTMQPQHYQYICGLKWAGGSGRGAALFTAAYDGSLRRLDVERGVSELVVSSEDAEYSCMDVTGDGRTALLGDNDGALQMVDVRAKGIGGGQALTLHTKKINTVHFEPVEEQVFATASTDTCIHLWDVRKMGQGMKPLATANHAQTCQAAMFAPDGSRRLVTTSFDSTIRVWDGAAGMAPLLTARHDNRTGRWVLPFRAVWSAAGDGIIVGNMKRFVDVLDACTGELTAQLHSEHMTAIASRNVIHPVLPVLAAATNSGRIHIFR